jgi:hypothetical protein
LNEGDGSKREHDGRKKEEVWGIFFYFGVVKMCKWWLEKFSNGKLSRDSSKKGMGDICLL